MNQTYISEALQATERSGVFMVTGAETPNLMTLGWAAAGNIWNKPVLVTPVRYTRYTYDLIERYHEFAISVPRKDLSSALLRCGQLTGRDTDKFKELHLQPKPAAKINGFIVGDCGLHLECRVIYKAGMEAFSLIDDAVKKQFYTSKNFHTMYFSEIIAAYTTD